MDTNVTFGRLVYPIYGCIKRKNWFPVGALMVPLFVPLVVSMPPLAD